MDVVNNPEDPAAGTRKVPFSRVLYIERDDFLEDAAEEVLPPGARPRSAAAQRLLRHVHARSSRTPPATIVELRCTYDPATRGGDAPDGRKVKATLHWVSAAHAVDAEVRLYDRLFTVGTTRPTTRASDLLTNLNPHSLEGADGCKLEPSLAVAAGRRALPVRAAGLLLRRSRLAPGAPVFNRTVTLKDAWARMEAREGVRELQIADCSD